MMILWICYQTVSVIRVSDLEDGEEDYIQSDDEGAIDSLLSDNRTSYEGDNWDENLFQLDPSASDIRTNTFTSRNKSETWKSELTKTTKVVCVAIMFCEKKSGLTNYAKRNVYYLLSDFFCFFRDLILKDICIYTNKKVYYELKDKCAPREADERKKFLDMLLLIGVQKSKAEHVSQLLSKSDGCPYFQ